MEMGVSGFESLPESIILQIFEDFIADPKDVAVLSAVCVRFSKLAWQLKTLRCGQRFFECYDEQVVTGIILHTTGLRALELEPSPFHRWMWPTWLKHAHTSLESLSATFKSWAGNVEPILKPIFTLCFRLQYLSLNIWSSNIRKVPIHMYPPLKKLLYLNLGWVHTSTDQIADLLMLTPSLKELKLDFVQCDGAVLTIASLTLENVYVTHRSHVVKRPGSIRFSCPRLMHLEVGGVDEVIIVGGSQLRQLTLFMASDMDVQFGDARTVEVLKVLSVVDNVNPWVSWQRLKGFLDRFGNSLKVLEIGAVKLKGVLLACGPRREAICLHDLLKSLRTMESVIFHSVAFASIADSLTQVMLSHPKECELLWWRAPFILPKIRSITVRWYVNLPLIHNAEALSAFLRNSFPAVRVEVKFSEDHGFSAWEKPK
ncbi:hypothetical protein CBR_g44381 [Chara braunii]|uniref:F-box domain-containing protein n=1 Tax=Chara braunii TaxID=69332 RepID=A0A388LX90_CHABU|nr:hypothetical protein CBR_g44381 [Chara braunii]|eukprot:GBG86926.1 hypothetical protein CBR_g44381 [Chara braunii]